MKSGDEIMVLRNASDSIEGFMKLLEDDDVNFDAGWSCDDSAKVFLDIITVKFEPSDDDAKNGFVDTITIKFYREDFGQQRTG